MRIVVIIIIIILLALYFGAGTDVVSEEENPKQDVESEESISSSREERNNNSLYDDLRKTFPIIESEDEIIRIAASAGTQTTGICPQPSTDVMKREEAWLIEQYDNEKDYVGPIRTQENLIRFASGLAEFPELERGASLVVARNILLDMAILEAKANLIEQFNVELSAGTYTDFPETGMTPDQAIYEKGENIRNSKQELNEEIEALDEEIERVTKAALSADEDKMAGIGFSDRMGASLDSFNRNLDETYKKEDITQEEKRLVEELLARVRRLENQKLALDSELEVLDGMIIPYKEAVVTATTVEKIAHQTLYGTKIVKQWFCFNEDNRSAALNVRLVWSTKLHQQAEAVLRRESVKLAPTEPGVPWSKFRLTMDKSMPTVGTYVDTDGNPIFYSVRHKSLDNTVITRQRRAAKALTEARLTLALFSEVASQDDASEALIVAGNGASSFTTEQYMGRMEEQAKNISISFQGLASTVENPMDGTDVLAHLSWIDAKTAAESKEIIRRIEATNKRFHKDQSYWKGLIAGMRAEGASTKNDSAANRKGFNDGSSGVRSAAQEDPLALPRGGNVERESVTRKKAAVEKSMRWESDVSDDF